MAAGRRPPRPPRADTFPIGARKGAFSPLSFFSQTEVEVEVYSIFYLIGVVVVVLAVLSFLGIA